MKQLPKALTERFNRFDEARADRMVKVFEQYIFQDFPQNLSYGWAKALSVQ